MSLRWQPSNRRLWPRALAAAVVGAALLALLAASLLAAIHCSGLGAADDAFITFRMAQNLADGHGLRFNPDGAPVEAASNFLLTVALAGAHRLHLSMIQSSLAISLVSTALTLLLLAWCAWRHVGPFGLLASAAWATMSLVPSNATNGLESSLFTLLLLVGVAIYVEADDAARPRRRLLLLSSLVFALLSMTRPEGPIFVLALGGIRLVDLIRRWHHQGRRGLDLRSEAWWAGGFILLYLPYTLWRVSYFGMLLPNTFHVKQMQFIEYSKLEAGALYLKAMVLQEPLLPLALLVGAAAHAIAPTRRLRTLLAVVIAQCLFMVLSGGDWPHMFGHGRFLLPAVPPMLWLLVDSGGRLLRLRRRLAVLVGTLVVVGLAQVNLVGMAEMKLPAHYHWQPRTLPTRQALPLAFLQELPSMPFEQWWDNSTQTFNLRRYHNNFDAVVGLWLRARYGPTIPIASIQAGQFAFWSGMPFFDMFGLASPEVAQIGSYDPARLAELIRRFDPSLIAFYKWDSGVHHRPLVLEGFLQETGYGLRYVFLRKPSRAFVVFEKGYTGEEDVQEVLFSALTDLPCRVNRDRLIAALDVNHPRL